MDRTLQRVSHLVSLHINNMKFPFHLRPLKSSTRRTAADVAGTKLFVDSFDEKEKKRRLLSTFNGISNAGIIANDLEFRTNVSILRFFVRTESRVVEGEKRKIISIILTDRMVRRKLTLGNFFGMDREQECFDRKVLIEYLLCASGGAGNRYINEL